tara:strand:+ start:159 stop:704 length:546 start_codon:yes stop_codon:yes gene_type:complete
MSRKQITSSKLSILKWWLSKDGQEYIDKLSTTYNLDFDKLKSLNKTKHSFCWACFREDSKTWNQSKLERCHILPDCDGGKPTPNNLVLLCKDCHKESPTLSDIFYFWEWFVNQEHHAFKFAKYIAQQANSLLNDDFKQTKSLKDSLKEVRETLKPVPVAGRFSDATKKAMIREIIKHQSKL